MIFALFPLALGARFSRLRKRFARVNSVAHDGASNASNCDLSGSPILLSGDIPVCKPPLILDTEGGRSRDLSSVFMTEAYVTALTAPDRMLLEALPCYVFLQRGGDIVYANRLARELLGSEEGAVFPVEDIFQGQFPGLVYSRTGNCQPRSKNVFGSGNLPYSTEFECRLAAPDGSSISVCGSCRMLQVEPEPQLLIAAMRVAPPARDGPVIEFSRAAAQCRSRKPS